MMQYFVRPSSEVKGVKAREDNCINDETMRKACFRIIAWTNWLIRDIAQLSSIYVWSRQREFVDWIFQIDELLSSVKRTKGNGQLREPLDSYRITRF